MSKLFKFIGRFIGISFEWILVLFIAFAFFIRTSQFQTFLAQQLAAYLSKELNTTIQIDKVAIIFFDRVALDGVLILDQQADTLLSVSTVYANFDEINLADNSYRIGKTELEKGVSHISKDQRNGEFNFQFLVDYFKSDKPKPEKPPLKLNLDVIGLNDVSIKYDDNQIKAKPYGIDYSHLNLANVKVELSAFNFDNDLIGLHIDNLIAKEKCGLNIQKWNSDIEVSPKGIKLDNVAIITPFSNISIKKFHLLTKNYSSFQSFSDSVIFDAEILKSNISSNDLALFVPQMEGMTQKFSIQTKIKSTLNKLKIENLEFKTGKKTHLKGSFQLPDFNNIKASRSKQQIASAYFDFEDLRNIRFPKTLRNPFAGIDKTISSNLFVKLKDFIFEGTTNNFKLKFNAIQTANGTLSFCDGIQLNTNDNFKSFDFHPINSKKPMLSADRLNLKAITGSSQLGIFTGDIRLDGEIGGKEKVKLSNIFANIKRLDLINYPFQSITIENSSFVEETINGIVKIADPNLKANFKGTIDIGKVEKANCTLDIFEANLEPLHLTKTTGSRLQSKFKIDVSGFDPSKINGLIQAEAFKYSETNKSFSDSMITLNISDIAAGKKYELISTLADINISGKVNFQTIAGDLISQFNKVFPSDITGLAQNKIKSKKPSQFSYYVDLKKINDFLAIFVPDFYILGKTKINGKYDGLEEVFQVDIDAEKVKYQDFVFQNLKAKQSLLQELVTADYNVQNLELSDSIHLETVHFNTNGTQRNLESYISWDTLTPNTSFINWNTTLSGKNKLDFKLKPSFFAINKLRWDIEKESDIGIDAQQVFIRNLKLQRGKQIISLNGALSKNISDKLTYKLKSIDLEDISQFLGSQTKLKGIVNGYGSLSAFYTNLTYTGDLFIDGLHVNEAEIGNIFILSDWNKLRESIEMEGDLTFRGNKTCQFEGDYFTNREKNSIDFDINFKNTDIQFAQDFLDSNTVTNLKGTLLGTINIAGTPSDPKVKGDVELNNGNVKIGLLGANFGLNGIISISDNLIYINKMKLSDEFTGKGIVEGRIIHNNFSNWNYRMNIDLAPNSFSLNQNLSDRFLIMNTTYKEGEIYHGTAFVKGSATIYGTTKETTIDVDVTTKKGSSLYFPMYGRADLKEDQSFITFKKKVNASNDNSNIKEEVKNNHALIMDLNFRVTPDAKMKIIFNDKTNDEITASGSGDINMKINRIGDLTMNGIYTIKEGKYNFAMGPVYRQEFLIDEGGTIAWKGDPAEATLDVKTRIDVTANLAELSPNEINNTSNSRQKVNCYLLLTEKLSAPKINFDIRAPKADETGKALVTRITSDADELNRQFISLIFWKRFQPLKGTVTAGGSAALDLVTNQINSLLSQISNDYRMGVNMDKDDITKESTYEFGVSKGFLDDRLVISGSFGVESNTSNGTGAQNTLIGDVNLEYLLNESGTVRVNVFNESNDNSIIKDKNLGLFTQGAGFNYQEEFDNFGNFKLGQYFLDIFRAKDHKKYPVKRKKQQTPVPTLNEPTGSIINNSKKKYN
jgi:hypothetical protein